MPNAGAKGHFAGIGFRALKESDAAAPVGAMLEIVFGDDPADRPVSQRHHLVGDAGIDERLGTDDRSGAPSAIHDDGRLGIGRYASRAQHQFGAGHADGAGDVHGRIFVEPPDIENRDIGSSRNQRGDVVRRQRRGMTAGLNQFAKRLGVGIHILEQLKARRLPRLQPAIELTNVRVTQCRQAIRSQGDEAFAGVADNDRHILAGQSRFGFERDPLSRHVGGKQRMAGGKGGLVPHIEQRDFIAQQQRAADLRGRDGRWGHGRLSLDENGWPALHGCACLFNSRRDTRFGLAI
jgi:hypothetical protein